MMTPVSRSAGSRPAFVEQLSPIAYFAIGRVGFSGASIACLIVRRFHGRVRRVLRHEIVGGCSSAGRLV
jgi:hypothetical protein